MYKRKQTIAKIKAEINRAGTTNYGRISGHHLDAVIGGVQIGFLWVLSESLPCDVQQTGPRHGRTLDATTETESLARQQYPIVRSGGYASEERPHDVCGV